MHDNRVRSASRAGAGGVPKRDPTRLGSPMWICAGAALLLLASAAWAGPEASPGPAAVFPMKDIISKPLDAKVLKTTEKDGIVIEEVEFTSDTDPAGKPVRTFGVLAYPKGGKKLPAIMWGQSGMYPAGDYFPVLFAKKGYISLCITLDLNTWKAFGPFDTANPAQANLVKLAIAHMRGITYLTSRPETDPERIGMGGASYGGLYATLVAGVDPRVKAGMSFFGGGRQELGTNLPQFNALKDLKEIEIFRRTADGAEALAKKPVPFLWGVAANDHWFYLPAMVQTYKDSAGDKRLGIVPIWAHAFPEYMDQELVDWFDTCLLKNRKPYNNPGELVIENKDGKLVAQWNWKGENPVKKAELVVSYGKVLPWHGWVCRLYQPLPATIEKDAARAEIPVPEPNLEVYVFGNIFDDHEVLVSTVPVAVVPSAKGISQPSGKVVLNGCPYGDFEPEDATYLERSGTPFGQVDKTQAHTGKQSARLDAPKPPAKPAPASLKLLNVPERGHRLSLWLKADKSTTMEVEVDGVAPGNWNTPAAKAILATMPAAWKAPTGPPPSFKQQCNVGAEWKEFTLDCPYDGRAVEGYELKVVQTGEAAPTCWIDTVRFEPVWK